MAYRYTTDRREPGAYHVFQRARDGIWLFQDDEDRRLFESLIDRHLSPLQQRDRRGRPYAQLRDEVRLNARNILSSHFHLILWQRIACGIERLMGRVLSTYTRHHHDKYGTSGPLFAGPYRARRIESPKSFMRRVGYVHDNHRREGLEWRFSTHRAYIDPRHAPGALDVESALKVFGGRAAYLDYMSKRGERNTLDAELRREDPLFKP